MFSLLLIINVAILAAMSSSVLLVRLGRVERSVINLLLMLIMMDMLFVLGFFLAEARLTSTGRLELGWMRMSSRTEFEKAFLVYTLNHAAMLVGIIIGATVFNVPRYRNVDSFIDTLGNDRGRVSAVILFVSAMTLSGLALIFLMIKVGASNWFA